MCFRIMEINRDYLLELLKQLAKLRDQENKLLAEIWVYLKK